MSRKQAAKARPAAAAARKGRRPRHSPAGPAPGPAPGHSGGLAGQLRALGLKLREVSGDGNCLFRALGDQLEGHSRNHLRHRQETVQFMVQQRADFEPFVEDDVPFDKHVANLAKPGTFAGNDAIVAFARNNQMNVVIHQLNTPLWQPLKVLLNGSTAFRWISQSPRCVTQPPTFRWISYFPSSISSPNLLRVHSVSLSRSLINKLIKTGPLDPVYIFGEVTADFQVDDAL